MKAGAVELEFMTNLARLQGELSTIRRAVGQTYGEAVREHNKAERAAVSYAESLEREAAMMGKTAREAKQLDIELRAVAAEAAGFDALGARIRNAGGAFIDVAKPARLARHDMINLSAQLQDIFVSLQGGQKPMTVFLQQGSQIGQIAVSSGVGLKGMALSVWALVAPFTPLIAVAGAAAAGMALFVRFANEGVSNNQLTRDLGDITHGADATKAELYKLKEETVTWGDVTKALFKVVGKDVMGAFVGDTKAMTARVKAELDGLTSYGKAALASLYAGLAGTKAYLAAIEKGGLLGIGKTLSDPKLLEKSYGAAYDQADAYLTKLGKRVKAAAKQVGYNNLPASKTESTDKHAAALAREAEATEAQIRNLYALGDAYGVSGAAALIAEAREKAESAAIRKRGDIEEAVARQVRLAIAQRVSDAAKSTAIMRDQAMVQEQVNAAVAAGNVPAQRAADLVRDRIADLPLLAALEAAQKVNDVRGAEAAAAALDAQRAARDRLTDAETASRLETDMANGATQLATMREELALIGATDAARVHALATLKATQEAEKNGYSGKRAANYVAQQVQIADLGETLRKRTDEHNKSLREQAEIWDEIGRRASESADNMSRAFGRVGDSIGDALVLLADYGKRQKELDEQKRLAAGNGGRLARLDQEATNLQLSTMIGLTGAAKTFFKERSAGYKAMEAAEKALTLVQLARTAVDVAGGAAKMFAQLGVGGFGAVAGMAAVMAGLGFAVSTGGGKNNLPASNTGTGTTLGDSKAESESITRALETLSDINKVTMQHSASMLTSLRSIDQKIGGLAALLVRTGNINASGGVAAGFKSDALGGAASYLATGGALGPILKQVPILGDLLGGLGGVVKSLFGTKTSVVASGLFGGPQTIADVLNAGFDASYFSDVKKTKKFFGISAGTKFSTQYTGADSEVEQQFGQILRGFYDTIGAAAGPLGLATGAVEDRLKGFVVDLGKIDLQGLTGEEISEKLTAVFGKAADEMARAAMPGLEAFQKVGEGYFETLTRVAVTMETVSTSLGRLGSNAQGLDIAASMGVAGLFDSLSDLTSASDAYFEKYFSEAERTAQRTAEMTKAFGALGLSMPGSLAAFRGLVEAQDLTTAAGQQTYATLLQIAPAFADLKGTLGEVAEAARSAADILKERQGLERDLLQVQGDTAALRALDLAALDATNRPLQQHIWALQDEAAAADAAAQAAAAEAARRDAIASERMGLEQQILQALGDTAALRQIELDKLDPSNRALQLRIYALADEAAATEAARQASEAAAAAAAQAEADALARAQAVASERAGLEQQLLQLQGNTAALREIELAGLDETNRALQRQIYALQDAQKAAEAANALREAWQSVGDTIMDEVKRIRGLADGGAGGGFASLMGQFNTATAAARSGDQEAAKLLPGLSQSLLQAAELAARSRQELDRVQGQTAASLEETYRMIERVTAASGMATSGSDTALDGQSWWNAFASSQAATAPSTDAQTLRAENAELRSEITGLREDLRTGLATIAGNTGKTAKILDGVTAESGGNAVTVRSEAA